jgi:hypothetical protein
VGMLLRLEAERKVKIKTQNAKSWNPPAAEGLSNIFSVNSFFF